jgi:diguanylate cyclase (GGDEF)-like protein
VVYSLLSGSVIKIDHSIYGKFILAVGIFLPPTFALLAWLKDSSVFSVQSFRFLSLLASFYGLITWLTLWAGPGVIGWLRTSYITALPFGLAGVASKQALPQLTLIAFALSLGLITLRLVMRRTWVNHCLFVIVCTLFVVLSAKHPVVLSAQLFFIPGVMLFAAILNDSHTMAYRDELTGIPGRRALNEYLKRLGNRYSLAMVDIDFFKKFNDTYGHDVGDQALKMVAARMARISGGGRVFRYGGEEFVIVFKRKGSSRSKVYLEDLREQIANYPMVIRSKSRPKKAVTGKKFRQVKIIKKRVKVTVSIGLAERNEQIRLPGQVLKAADKALYKAKKAGRNCLYAA